MKAIFACCLFLLLCSLLSLSAAEDTSVAVEIPTNDASGNSSENTPQAFSEANMTSTDTQDESEGKENQEATDDGEEVKVELETDVSSVDKTKKDDQHDAVNTSAADDKEESTTSSTGGGAVLNFDNIVLNATGMNSIWGGNIFSRVRLILLCLSMTTLANFLFFIYALLASQLPACTLLS